VPIYALGTQVPSIDPTAYVHPDAVVIGSVTIGPESTIWAGAVLRGDDGNIVIGARTSIQDGTVIHTTPMYPTTVGDDCVIGHIVHLEGCTIEKIGAPVQFVGKNEPLFSGRVKKRFPPDYQFPETFLD
jgi:carbonic anhydrase/acetyltransferase-like protein (isoleucine patch superfamily)